MVKIKAFINKYVPTPSAVIMCVFLFALIIWGICRISTMFADFWNVYIGSVIRGTLAYATGWIPFSLAEFILLSMPVTMVCLIVHAWCSETNTTQQMVRYLFGIFSIPAVIFSILMLGFSAGYCTQTVDERLSLEKQPVSSYELYDTAKWLLENVNAEASSLSYGQNGASVMPYTLSELDDKINDAYKTVCREHTFIQKLNTSVKPVVMSEIWTYTHISGVYTFFTGEANINTNFPEYTLPFTVAHEMAHQRGISREEEANFIAFLVCTSSDDPYIRYSGYLSVYEYVASALYKSDSKLYFKLISNDMTQLVKGELICFDEFFEKYRTSTASDVVSTVQDAYLQGQGQSEGSRSYNLVTDLAVAYYKANAEKD